MRTDLTIVPNPPVEMMQQWDQAGALGLDTDFSTRILRVTDPATAVGKPIFTSDAGQANLWNTNSTMFVLKAMGGQKLVFTFNPQKMKATMTNTSLTGDVCFSRTVSNRFYVMQGTVVTAWNFKTVLGIWTYVSKQKVCDFATILPKTFTPNWNGVFGISRDDSTFSFAFSATGQDTGFYVAVFKRGKGFRLWNTQTGDVTGTYGVKGKIAMPPFTLHEAYQTPSSKYCVVIPSAGAGVGCLFWDLDTLVCSAGKLSGHAVHGEETYRTGGPGGGQWAEIQYASPQSKRMLIPQTGLPEHLTVGQHGSENTFTSKDINPFIATYANKGPVVSAWQGEIVQIYPLTGVVQRICHHFASETSPYFDVANAMAVQSQDGRWVMFASDLLGTIKGDVFIAPLQAPFV